MEICRFKKTTKNKERQLNIPQEILPRNSCQNQEEGEVHPYQIRPGEKKLVFPDAFLMEFLEVE